MPFNFSAAHSSRIAKRPQARNSPLRRSSSSTFTRSDRRKPIQRSKSKYETCHNGEDYLGERLQVVGLTKTLSTGVNLKDIVQTIQSVKDHMFDSVPESGGFNSTRIAEILNFRKSLPPIVTVAQVHALLSSPTSTERKMAELVSAGVVRRVIIPGRGTGGSNAGESLVLFNDIDILVHHAKNINADLANKFLQHLRNKPRAQIVDGGPLTAEELKLLMGAGYLTSASAANTLTGLSLRSNVPLLGTSPSISAISKTASGSLAAVGGEHAIQDAGGRSGLRRSSSQFEAPKDAMGFMPKLQLSLPGMGPYLKLLTAARSHLVSIIAKSHFHEMPLYLLKERWEGGISGDDPAAKAKKYRGEFGGVLPVRTRKWKQFSGLSFNWVLAECFGAGLIELFETGSVGEAARIP